MKTIENNRKYDIEEKGGLVLEPQGAISPLIFHGGISRCGISHNGMSVTDKADESGGYVLTLEDIVRLRDHLNNHLKKIVGN